MGANKIAKEKMIQCKYDEALKDLEEIIRTECCDDEILDEARLLLRACKNIKKGQQHIKNNTFKEGQEVFETVLKTLQLFDCCPDLQTQPKNLLEKCKKASQAQQLIEESKSLTTQGQCHLAIEKLKEAKTKCNQPFIEDLCITQEIQTLRQQVEQLKFGNAEEVMEELKDGVYKKACGFLQDAGDLNKCLPCEKVQQLLKKETVIEMAYKMLQGGSTEKKLAELKVELCDEEKTILNVRDEKNKAILEKIVVRLRKRIGGIELFLEAKKKLGEVMLLVKKTKKRASECSEMDALLGMGYDDMSKEIGKMVEIIKSFKVEYFSKKRVRSEERDSDDDDHHDHDYDYNWW